MSDHAPHTSLEKTLNQQIENASKLLRSDPHEAFVLAQAVMQQAELERDPHTYARALRVRAMCQGAMGNLEACNMDFQACLEQAQSLDEVRLQSQCLHGLGNVHFHRGEFALALECVHRSIVLSRVISDELDLMIGLNALGVLTAELGDFTHAVIHFTESLQIARRRCDLMNEAMALCNIGQAQLDLGEPEHAVEHLTESVRLLREASARVYEPIALESLAKAHQQLGHLEDALRIGQEAIQICQDLENQALEVNALYVVANIQADRGEVDIAEPLFLQALQLAQTIQAGTRLAEIYCALGRLYLRNSDFDRARNALEAGLAYAQQTEQKHLLSELQLALSELYVAMGDHQRALEAHRVYHRMYRAQQKESAQNRLSAQMASLEVERAQQQAEIHRLRNVELTELSTKDPLTGLYNRRYLQDYLKREVEDPHHLTYLSVAVTDLDNFKQINDRFSHLIGDEVLKVTARLIQNAVRHSDIAVRFGGEEFVIVLPDMLRTAAAEVCERVRRAIASYDWASIHPDLQVTTSIGVADTTEAALDWEALDSPTDRLLALADRRLYRAKKLGKNQVVWN